MSLILDALKRAERERRELMPAFADADPSALSTPQRRRRWLRIVAVLLLLAGVLAIGWYFLGRRPALAPAPVPAVASTPAPPASNLEPIFNTAPPPREIAEPTVIPGTEGMVSLDELAPAPAALPPPVESAPVPKPVAKPTPSAPAPGSAAQANPEPAPELESAPEPGIESPEANSPAPESRAPNASRPPPPVLTQPVPLRRLREMTPEYRADFPALTIEVHVYEHAVAKRWVMVNGKRYKEGERLVEGPALLEIVADGLVVEFRGEKLLYPLSR